MWITLYYPLSVLSRNDAIKVPTSHKPTSQVDCITEQTSVVLWCRETGQRERERERERERKREWENVKRKVCLKLWM